MVNYDVISQARQMTSLSFAGQLAANTPWALFCATICGFVYFIIFTSFAHLRHD
jgi:hypothetical protein